MNEGDAAPAGGSDAAEAARDLFPRCVAWTSLPGLTFLYPAVGHAGVCTADGRVSDFQGPYTVVYGRLAFGRPRRCVAVARCAAFFGPAAARAAEALSAAQWDAALADAAALYRGRSHSLLGDNCHAHVAYAVRLAAAAGAAKDAAGEAGTDGAARSAARQRLPCADVRAWAQQCCACLTCRPIL